MVKLQRDFLRQIAGVATAPNRLLFKELGQAPLHVHWYELVFRYWNKLVRSKGSIYHHVFREEIRLALTSAQYHNH